MNDVNDWRNYLDMRYGRPFRFAMAGDEELMFEREDVTVLRPGADQAILSSSRCAAEFLRRLGTPELNLSQQEGIIELLLEVHKRCHHSGPSWKALQPDLAGALGRLTGNVAKIFKSEQCELELSKESLSESYAFGAAECIKEGLSVARKVAHVAFLEGLVQRLTSSSRPADLCGRSWLVAYEPEDQEYAQHFDDYFGTVAHARMTKQDEGHRWSIGFCGFPPIRPWFSLEQAACEAAAPLVAYTLSAKVDVFFELDD